MTALGKHKDGYHLLPQLYIECDIVGHNLNPSRTFNHVKKITEDYLQILSLFELRPITWSYCLIHGYGSEGLACKYSYYNSHKNYTLPENSSIKTEGCIRKCNVIMSDLEKHTRKSQLTIYKLINKAISADTISDNLEVAVVEWNSMLETIIQVTLQIDYIPKGKLVEYLNKTMAVLEFSWKGKNNDELFRTLNVQQLSNFITWRNKYLHNSAMIKGESKSEAKKILNLVRLLCTNLLVAYIQYHKKK